MDEQPIRIWIVEDNPGDLYLFCAAFHRAGVNFDLLEVRDGAEVLTLIGIEETSNKRLGARSCRAGSAFAES